MALLPAEPHTPLLQQSTVAAAGPFPSGSSVEMVGLQIKWWRVAGKYKAWRSMRVTELGRGKGGRKRLEEKEYKNLN